MMKNLNFLLIAPSVLICSVLHAMENHEQYELTHAIQSDHVKAKITFVKMFADYQLVIFNELGMGAYYDLSKNDTKEEIRLFNASSWSYDNIFKNNDLDGNPLLIAYDHKIPVLDIFSLQPKHNSNESYRHSSNIGFPFYLFQTINQSDNNTLFLRHANNYTNYIIFPRWIDNPADQFNTIQNICYTGPTGNEINEGNIASAAAQYQNNNICLSYNLFNTASIPENQKNIITYHNRKKNRQQMHSISSYHKTLDGMYILGHAVNGLVTIWEKKNGNI